MERIPRDGGKEKERKRRGTKKEPRCANSPGGI